MKKLFYSALMIIAFGGCQTAIDEPVQVESPVTFSAEIETLDSPTKTAMTDQRQIVWSKGDQIAIFCGNNVADTYQIADECADTQNVEFTKIVDNDPGEKLDATVALYPYTDNLSIEKVSTEDSDASEYEISGFVLPEKQTYCEDSFGEGTFPMVALTDVRSNSLSFKNLLGAIKLQLVGTELVKSIRIEGKNGERLSGAAAITVYSDGQPPLVRMSDESATSATLDCGNGVQLDESEATTFIIALPPVNFSNGFIVNVYDADGNVTQKLEAKSSNEVIRSTVLSMPVKKDELSDFDPVLESEGIEYVCEIITNTSRLYSKVQQIKGHLVTYSKDDKEISREPFTKDINLEVLFSIPEIVYVDKESDLTTVKLTGSSRDGDRESKRKEDGFTIIERSINSYFRFNAEEKVTVNRKHELLKYGDKELAYTYIESVNYKSYDLFVNEELTNDDTVAYDVTLFFEVVLKGVNQATAQTQTHIVAVPYTRVYERVEHIVAENSSCTGQFGFEDKRLYTIEQKVNGELVSYTKTNREISREPFSKDLNLEVLFSVPEIVYVDKDYKLSTVSLVGNSRTGDRESKREEDGFTITTSSLSNTFKFDANEIVTATRSYESLKYGKDELPYTCVTNVKYKRYESKLNEEETNNDIIVHDMTLYFEVDLKVYNQGTTQTQTQTVGVSYQRVYERVEHTVAENSSCIGHFASEDKRLYTVEQKVNGDLVTYSKYDEEISREPFSKDINLEVVFSVPEIVYVNSESMLSSVSLTANSKGSDKTSKREVDGFTITTCILDHTFRFNGGVNVSANTQYEKAEYENDVLAYNSIESVSYKRFESIMNEEQTNDDAIVHDVTLYFEITLKERNQATAEIHTHTVGVSYKRVYELKEHVEVDE